MARRRKKSDCPIHYALRVFGDAWTLLILRDFMFEGKSSYTEFLKSDEGIATNILADRLVRLEEDGIISKQKTAEGGEGRHYRLTKKGADLLPVVIEIVAWAAEHGKDVMMSDDLMQRLKTNKTRLVRELHTRLKREGRSAEPKMKPERARRRRLSSSPAPKKR